MNGNKYMGSNLIILNLNYLKYRLNLYKLGVKAP